MSCPSVSREKVDVYPPLNRDLMSYNERAEDRLQSIRDMFCRQCNITPSILQETIIGFAKVSEPFKEAERELRALLEQKIILAHSLNKKEAWRKDVAALEGKITAQQETVKTLREELEVFKREVESAKLTQENSAAAFFAAKAKRDAPKIQGARKTELNKKLPGLEKEKSKAQTAHQQTSKNLDAKRLEIEREELRLQKWAEEKEALLTQFPPSLLNEAITWQTLQEINEEKVKAATEKVSRRKQLVDKYLDDFVDKYAPEHQKEIKQAFKNL